MRQVVVGIIVTGIFHLHFLLLVIIEAICRLKLQTLHTVTIAATPAAICIIFTDIADGDVGQMDFIVPRVGGVG
jgi:uncharacterized membrane protein